MATLIVLGLPAAGTRHLIQKHRHVILGRDPTCDVILQRQAVSRFHAQVLSNQGHYYLEDLQSTNGTFLNGRRVQKRETLQDGDRITLHDIPIAFYVSDEVPRAADETVRNIVADGDKQSTEFELAATSGAAGVRTLRGRLETLIEISRDLGSSLELNEILPRVLDLLFRMFTQTIIGEIHLVETDGQLRPVAMKHGRDADSTDLTGAPFNVELIQEVLKSGQGIVRTEEGGDASMALDGFTQCTVCAPILGPESIPWGVILLQADGSSFGFSDDDLELVSAVAVLTGQSIGYARAHDIVVEHNNTQRQLETARQIQLGMLPRERPQYPGYDFVHHYAAAERVGGDYFFYEMLRDGRVIFGIADASGKGLPAAMHIVRFAGEVRLRIATSPTLKSAVASLNQFVMDGADECMFITACICVLDPRQNLLTLANAGHPPPLLKRKSTGKVEQLLPARKSFPLGIARNYEIHPLTVAIDPGDQVVLYTDGVSEAMNHRNELFGTERLTAEMDAQDCPIDQMLSNIVSKVERFREGRAPSDDMTIVGFERGIR
ncbi:SpoIIE family protein phosphatase [Planctomicrobium piriforme]|uniref:Serine phosphatase RsbU, regulator of sigma subunit n=1 Tax=Planctomicrobium piriforme TaxID=1576369 RepID=A0A1I3NJ35_9PLAN|nr:SpoIIE family protein phosphatase [Planctomicrobium piriforme]SFJ08756.1 Serine phosphatase RsbU, regulator of sigma subunit [Planctomicrobium piriforme]